MKRPFRPPVKMDEVDTSLAVLAMVKMAYDAQMISLEAIELCADSYCEVWLEIIESVCDEIPANEWVQRQGYDTNEDNDDEYYDSVDYYEYLTVDLIHYIEFCREYSSKNNIPWNENPYVLDAVQFVDSAMMEVPDWCFDYFINNEPNQLVILFAIDYDGFASELRVIEMLHNISLFFTEKAIEFDLQTDKRSAA